MCEGNDQYQALNKISTKLGKIQKRGTRTCPRRLNSEGGCPDTIESAYSGKAHKRNKNGKDAVAALRGRQGRGGKKKDLNQYRSPLSCRTPGKKKPVVHKPPSERISTPQRGAGKGPQKRNSVSRKSSPDKKGREGAHGGRFLLASNLSG